MKTIAYLESILSDEGLRMQIIKDELTEMVEKYVLLNISSITKIACTRSSFVTFNSIYFLISHCTQLTSINFSQCMRLENEAIESLTKNNRNLTEINLSNTKISDEGVCSIGYYCPNLTTLNINRCMKVSDYGIQTLCSNCIQLTALCAEYVTYITDKSMEYLAQCTQLKVLHITNNTNIRNLTPIADACPHLTLVNFAMNTNISELSLHNLCSQCIHLVEINLEKNTNCNSSVIDAITSHCVGLTSLNINYCYLVSTQAMINLVTTCTKLTTLQIAHCYGMETTESLLDTLVACAHNLTFMNLVGNSSLAVRHVRQIAAALPKLNNIFTSISTTSAYKTAEDFANVVAVNGFTVAMSNEGLTYTRII